MAAKLALAADEPNFTFYLSFGKPILFRFQLLKRFVIWKPLEVIDAPEQALFAEGAIAVINQ